ncbi:MAG: hypothetical protein ACOYNY_15950 [Caldilineaceae bacterium]
MAEFFDDQLLHAFMHHFYGYGNYQADYWFIGMEEGGGDTFDEVCKRLTVWDQRGQQELEDVAEYHIVLGITHPFAEKPKLQPTWAKLIRVLLSIEGETPTKDDVRRYQQQQWARRTGNVCLLELLPLPSPSTSHWLYAQHSQLPDLITREHYRERWSALRIERLRQRITKHQPKAVIFYGFGYLPYWTAIVGAPLQPILAGTMVARHQNNCLYLVLKHPAATGVTSEYFHEAGRYIRSALVK